MSSFGGKADIGKPSITIKHHTVAADVTSRGNCEAVLWFE